jgi:predicted permease
MGHESDVYVPLVFKPLLTPNWNGTDRWSDCWLYLFARPQRGLSRVQAQAALNGVFAGLLERQSGMPQFYYRDKLDRFLHSRLTFQDGSHGQSNMRNETRTPLITLMCATVLVLLIAMANAANLLLARSAERRREMAIRAAMGAGRGDLMGQMLTEALLLAACGGMAGLGFAVVTLKLLLAELSGYTPIHFLQSQLEWPVLLFGLGLSVVTGLLFGLYPAWEAARCSAASTLKNESGQSSGTASSARVRKVLVCAQVMVSAMLLIPTGLFLKSLVNLMRVDLGMKTENVIGFSVSPALNGYKQEQTYALFERIEAEMAAVPGVKGVAAAMVPLIAGNNWDNDVKIAGSKESHGDDNSRFNEIGPGYFGKMGVPLIAGREFAESDSLAAPKVAVVNQTFVRRFLEGRRPLGVQFSGGGNPPDITIVGDAAGLLPALAAGQGNQRHLFLRALGAAGKADDAADPAHHRVAGPRPAAAGPADPGRPDQAEYHGGPHRAATGGGLCRPRHRACHARPLRGDGALGDAAHARDRHPHGAGRGAGWSSRHGDARTAVDSDRRVGDGSAGGHAAGALCRVPVVRR